jgi:hypothetical protein
MQADPLPTTIRIDGVETSFQRRGLAARIGWASLAALVVPVAALLVGRALIPPHVRGALAAFTLVSPVLAVLAFAVRVFRWRRPGSIAVAGSSLHLERSGHDRSIPLDDLAAGHVSPLRRSVTLALVNGDLVHAHLATVEDGQRLLVATGLDASRRTMQIRLGETFYLDFLALALGPGVFSTLTMWAGAFGVLVSIGLTAALFAAVRAFFGPADLVIGADGIIVRQDGSSRFVPFAQIASLDPGPPEGHGRYVLPSQPLVLRLVDGSEVHARTRHLAGALRAELWARLADAQRAWEAGTASAAALAQLDRSGRPASAWRQAMLALLATPEGYRAQAITHDALVDVLESPAAPAERRLGAAMALAGGGDPAARARIRIAARACADERLRVALEHAAEDTLDEDDVEHAIAAREGR